MKAEIRALGYLLLIIFAVRVGGDQVPRHIPFLEILDSIRVPGYRWGQACFLLFLASAALALVPRYFSWGCLAAGATLLLRVLINMPMYSNGALFCALMLLLVGLCRSQRGVTLLRAQCVLVYLGGGLAKALDVDWWNGRFISAIFAYHPSAAWIPDSFAQMFGIASIGAELGIAALLLFPATRNFAVLTVAAFHTSILLTLSEDFTTFYYAIVLSCALLFLKLPTIERLTTPLDWLAEYSMFSEVREAPRQQGRAAAVVFERGELRGWTAVLFQLLCCLPVMAVLLAVNSVIARQGLPRLRDVIVSALVLAAFFLAWRSWRTNRS